MKGSITKKGNKYYVVVDLPRGADGKRNQHWSSGFDSKEEAEAEQARIVHELNTGMFIKPTKDELSNFLDRWLEDIIYHSQKHSTYERYKNLIKNHVNPLIGGVKLSDLRPMHLQSLYSEKLKKGNMKTGKGLSPNTVKMIHNVIHNALDTALKWQMVPRNVANAVEPPRAEEKEMDYLNHEQVKKFLKFSKEDERYYPLFFTAVMTGLRRGELLGLRWKDIDLGLRRLAVRKSLTRKGNEYVLTEPKSKSSNRTVDLSAMVVKELKRHRSKQAEERLQLGEEYNDRGLVFTRQSGEPIHPNTLLRHFKKALNKANLPKIRFHDLRHTHATLMLSQGVNPKVISERLGHSKIETTLDRYSHVLPNMQSEAADLLEDALFAK